jgi:non-heme chloroperoxidase
VEPVEALIRNWWRQGMMAGLKAAYDCIAVFSETDFTEDLKAIEIPVLVMHSEGDQIVPYADSGPLAVNLLRNGLLKTYKDLPHGMPSTHPEIINADLLAFIRGEQASAVQAEGPTAT